MSKGKPFLFNMNNEIEIWKDVPGYEGSYQCSNLGRLKTVIRITKNRNGVFLTKEKILNGSVNRFGYRAHNLVKDKKIKRYEIHQLVAITFLNHIPNKQTFVVDHIDNDCKNNKLTNLRIVSHRENISKGFLLKKSTSKYIGVYLDKKRNKWGASIYVNGKNTMLGRFETEIEAHNIYQNKLKEIENE